MKKLKKKKGALEELEKALSNVSQFHGPWMADYKYHTERACTMSYTVEF